MAGSGNSSMLNPKPAPGTFTPYNQSFAQIGEGPKISPIYTGSSGIVPINTLMTGINPPVAPAAPAAPAAPGTPEQINYSTAPVPTYITPDFQGRPRYPEWPPPGTPVAGAP
jgi:hypothetical protein